MPSESFNENIQRIRLMEGSDHEMYDAIRNARDACESKEDLQLLHDTLDDILPFICETDDKRLNRLASLYRTMTSHDIAMRTLLEEHQNDLSGVELQNDSGTQYAVFMPDATESGRFRYSIFNEGGFYGHTTRDSYEELVKDAFQCGFRHKTQGHLERCFMLDSFHEGNEFANKVMRVNAGEPWDDVFVTSKSSHSQDMSL